MKKVAIYGGTFNPIHNGHIIAMHTLVDCGFFDEINILPSGIPPFKHETKASYKHRITMVKTITNKITEIIYNGIEEHSTVTSYTYDTLKQLSAMTVNTEFYWVIGYDNLFSIMNWHDADKLLKKFKFAVFNRGGFDKTKASVKMKEITSIYGTEFIELSMPNVEISSTDIRHRVSQNKSIIGYTPSIIIDYINNYGLYRNEVY